MNKGEWGKLRAFFDVQTDEGFTIKGFKIIEGINGLFISPPSQKGKDEEYYDTVFIAPELREELNHIALQEYGMQPDNAEDFEFPASEKNTTEAPTAEAPTAEAPTAESRESTDNSVEPAMQTENNTKEETTFSEDDIPF